MTKWADKYGNEIEVGDTLYCSQDESKEKVVLSIDGNLAMHLESKLGLECIEFTEFDFDSKKVGDGYVGILVDYNIWNNDRPFNKIVEL